MKPVILAIVLAILIYFLLSDTKIGSDRNIESKIISFVYLIISLPPIVLPILLSASLMLITFVYVVSANLSKNLYKTPSLFISLGVFALIISVVWSFIKTAMHIDAGMNTVIVRYFIVIIYLIFASFSYYWNIMSFKKVN
jgi:hypothetical protein